MSLKKNKQGGQLNKINYYLVGLIILILIRLYFVIFLPLMDKTEARYANIARIMAETNDWIVLQIDYGIPFWAKPPLSTWVSALSQSVFGATAWAARMPYLLGAILLALWIGKYSKHKNNYFASFVLFSIPEFYLHAGVVSTDLMLSISIALIMLSFWEIIIHKKNQWNYGLFIAVGLGMLSKGPISLALTLPPIFLWTIHFKKIKLLIFKLWWVRGTIISLVITLPWYLLIEHYSPGFYDYFIIGEHFQRYFDSSWKGDKYGFPKQQPLGIIWVFLLTLTVPWILLLFQKGVKKIKTIVTDEWSMFLIYWIIWTPFLFTFSKSLIHPYILPVMVPIALLTSELWKSVRWKKAYFGFALGLPLLLFGIGLSGITTPIYDNNSDKKMVASAQKENFPIFTLNEKSYSSQFYSNGKIKRLKEDQIDSLMKSENTFYLIVKDKDFKNLDHSQKEMLKPVIKTKSKGCYRFEKLP